MTDPLRRPATPEYTAMPGSVLVSVLQLVLSLPLLLAFLVLGPPFLICSAWAEQITDRR